MTTKANYFYKKSELHLHLNLGSCYFVVREEFKTLRRNRIVREVFEFFIKTQKLAFFDEGESML